MENTTALGSELLNRLTSPSISITKKAEGSLIMRATERAHTQSARQLRSWHKNCVRAAALISAADGNQEEAQVLALEFLSMEDNKR